MPTQMVTADSSAPSLELSPRRYGVIAGGLHLLLPRGVSAELLHDQSLTRILLAPPALSGVANVRGALLPVFELARLISDASGVSHPADQILMLGTPPQALGILIHGFSIPLSDLQPLSSVDLPEVLQPYLQGAWQQQNTIWLDIDLLQLFRDFASQKQYLE